MALRYIDGFDLYTTATTDLATRWGTAPTSSTYVALTTGRSGSGQAVRLYNTSSGVLGKTLDAQATWIVGFALKIEAMPSSSVPYLVEFRDSAASSQASVIMTPTGALELFRGGQYGTLLAASADVIAINVWNYIEIKLTVADSAGVFEVRVNGTVVASYTGDTKASSSIATASTVRFYAIGSSNCHFDDLYICDGTGSRNNSYLGDCRVDALLPTGAGNTTQFTQNGGTSNWDNVASANPLDATKYNSADTVGYSDSFALADLSALGSTIKGVQSVIMAKKDDAGERTMKSKLRISSTDYYGTTQALASSYAFVQDIFETNPNTSTTWTESDINGMEIGYEVAA